MYNSKNKLNYFFLSLTRGGSPLSEKSLRVCLETVATVPPPANWRLDPGVESSTGVVSGERVVVHRSSENDTAAVGHVDAMFYRHLRLQEAVAPC